ncbi:MAG: hypothetical protein WHU94_07195, partial [Thermogemmata sp.]
MRHPFDGIILPPSEGQDGANGENQPVEETVSRRDWLQRLLAASAGMLALPLAGNAVPPPAHPPGQQEPAPAPTTLALKEEGNPPPKPNPTDPQPEPKPTTLALGEEGNPP